VSDSWTRPAAKRKPREAIAGRNREDAMTATTRHRSSLALRSLAFAVLTAVTVSAAASAESYPSRTVTIVVPYAPGGASDVLGRLVAKRLQDKLGQTFIVENRPGAGTLIGAEHVARSAPDGYTLLLATSTTLAINASLYKKLPYDPAKDFTAIGLVANVPFVLVANPSLKVKSMKDFIALAKSEPGKLNYGSAGNGSPHHLFMELLKSMSGINVTHVPYKGSAPAMMDLLSNHVSVMISDLAPALSQIRSGKVVPLGVTTETRLDALPEVPTIAEAGVPDYSATAWQGIVGPAGMPADVVKNLSDELRAFSADAETKAAFTKVGLQPASDTPSEFDAYIKSEIGRWAGVVRSAGATIN
jgi:tripartite-type tricarboxylate transporter receptor subunit TctC